MSFICKPFYVTNMRKVVEYEMHRVPPCAVRTTSPEPRGTMVSESNQFLNSMKEFNVLNFKACTLIKITVFVK